MNSARMDRRITFQEVTETQSATGFSTKAWADYVTVWAQVTYKSGKEYFEADKVNAEVVKLFRVRHRSDLTNKMRIVYESRNYDILSIDSDYRKGETYVTAKAEAL
jgi:SPP1 family predicted phage head-tail adaptor